MARLLISFSAALAMAALPLAAEAGPLSGSFNMSIYQGTNPNPGNGSDPSQQANQSNPLINAGDLIAQGLYTGAIDFSEIAPGYGNDGNIESFLTSASGGIFPPQILGGTLGSLGSTALSSDVFDLTTVIVITGNIGAGTFGGTLTHDDGVSLYDGAGYGHTVLDASGPVYIDTTSYNGLTGAFELIYVEANSLPAELDFEVNPSTDGFVPTSFVPEPITFSLFGAGLAGAVAIRRRKKTT